MFFLSFFNKWAHRPFICIKTFFITENVHGHPNPQQLVLFLILTTVTIFPTNLFKKWNLNLFIHVEVKINKYMNKWYMGQICGSRLSLFFPSNSQKNRKRSGLEFQPPPPHQLIRFDSPRPNSVEDTAPTQKANRKKAHTINMAHQVMCKINVCPLPTEINPPHANKQKFIQI